MDTGTSRYDREVLGQDHFEGRAGIAGLAGSVGTSGVARAYLDGKWGRIAKASVPAEWRRAFG